MLKTSQPKSPKARRYEIVSLVADAARKTGNPSYAEALLQAFYADEAWAYWYMRALVEVYRQHVTGGALITDTIEAKIMEMALDRLGPAFEADNAKDEDIRSLGLFVHSVLALTKWDENEESPEEDWQHLRNCEKAFFG